MPQSEGFNSLVYFKNNRQIKSTRVIIYMFFFLFILYSAFLDINDHLTADNADNNVCVCNVYIAITLPIRWKNSLKHISNTHNTQSIPCIMHIITIINVCE